MKLIKGNFATLANDRWSNATNNPVIEVAFCTAGKTCLVNVMDTSGFPHTHENLYESCDEQFKKCEEEWCVNVTCLVTDNAANMLKM